MSVETAAAVVPDWLTVKEAAARVKVSDKLIYHAIKQGRLRAARLGTRKDIRILSTWLDAWAMAESTPTVINEQAPGGPPAPGAIPFNRRGSKPSA
jgi:excisionase family DNA binding protein